MNANLHMFYRLLSKFFRFLYFAKGWITAGLYHLAPQFWFRSLGKNCRFDSFPRFGYMFRDIRVGSFCNLGVGVFLNCGPNGVIEIGNNVGLNDYTYISSLYGVHIGDNTRIGEFVSIRDNDHNFSDGATLIRQQGFVGGPIDIGSDVWIGRGVFIGKGVSIGKGAVVGANSVVTKAIPAFAIAVGSPAKVIKYRHQL